MKIHRFYIPNLIITKKVCTLNEKNTVHQIHTVFRMKKDSVFCVFDGSGTDYHIKITNITKKLIEGMIIHQTQTQAPTHKKALAVALLKRDNIELLCQKVTEIGITDIYLMTTDRMIKQNVSFERLEKIIVEAVEQSGRGDIPRLHKTKTLVETYEETQKDYVTYVADIGAELPIKTHHQNTLVFIGPEGGWSEEEKVFFKEKEITLVSLGQFILRAETAAIVAATYII